MRTTSKYIRVKVLKERERERLFMQPEEKDHLQQSNNNKTDRKSLSETMEVRRKWNSIFKLQRKQNNCQSTILYPEKCILENKGKTKHFKQTKVQNSSSGNSL